MGDYFRFTHWSKLFLISNSKIAQYALVVPFLGYFILLNENVSSTLSLVSDRVHLGRPLQQLVTHSLSEYRMYFTYYGASIVAITALIIRVCTPEQVQDSISGLEKGKSISINQFDFAGFLQRTAREDPTVLELSRELKDNGVIISDIKPGANPTIENWTPGLREAVWSASIHIAERRFPPLRIFLATALMSGMLLTAVPPLDTFARVTVALWQRIFP